jgi:predicted Rossmann fold nucleotide-binding protein DprA/Smf involved in DNA uptake
LLAASSCSEASGPYHEGETWLTLTANGLEIHRELATWEDTEPAHRLLALLQQRYGERLRSFNFNPAILYLAGDRLSYGSELDQLVASLPERDGRSSANERRDD